MPEPTCTHRDVDRGRHDDRCVSCGAVLRYRDALMGRWVDGAPPAGTSSNEFGYWPLQPRPEDTRASGATP